MAAQRQMPTVADHQIHQHQTDRRRRDLSGLRVIAMGRDEARLDQTLAGLAGAGHVSVAGAFADAEQTSEVEVRFIAETTQRTRVELEHRNIDRHGPGWEAVRDGVGGDAGWPLYLARYATLFTDKS